MSAMWTPISPEELQAEIDTGAARMLPREGALWRFVRITPEKWQLSPWGDDGGGFWVVAVFGETCIYYNDIEHGFNESQFAQHGVIADYLCNQDKLEWVIRRMMEAIDAG